MLDFSIPIYGGPGDGGKYFPVGGIPASMLWPSGNGREDLYELIRVGYQYRYVHASPGEKTRGKETRKPAVSRRH